MAEAVVTPISLIQGINQIKYRGFMSGDQQLGNTLTSLDGYPQLSVVVEVDFNFTPVVAVDHSGSYFNGVFKRQSRS